MEIVTKNEGEALALATALQRISPTPVEAGRLPAVRGDAVNGVTSMLAQACLVFSPMERAIAEGIISGQIASAPKAKRSRKTKKTNHKAKAKKKVVKRARKRK